MTKEEAESTVNERFEKAKAKALSNVKKFLYSKPTKKSKPTSKSQKASINLNSIRANTQRVLNKGTIGSIHFKKEWEADKRELFFS